MKRKKKGTPKSKRTSSKKISFDQELDACGLTDTRILLKTHKAMKKLTEGEVLRIVFTDKNGVKKLRKWAKEVDDVSFEASKKETMGDDICHVVYLERIE